MSVAQFERMGRNKGLALILVIVATLLFGTLPVCSADGEHDGSEEAEVPLRNFLDRDESLPRFNLHGFGDINLFVEEGIPETGNDTDAFFSVGEFDLYVTSALSTNVSFLSEVVFELEDDGTFVVDIERLFLKYTLSDRFWISLGRRHNPLGFWNQAFHHGLLLQPTVGRPLALRFEDNGGILPTHGVGFETGGRWFHRNWTLDYTLGITNGRGADRSVVQGSSDLNDHKAINLKLSFAHENSRKLRFGPMIYLDRIPALAGSPERDGEIEERILGAHLTYRDDHIELFAEYFQIHHLDTLSALAFDHPAYYVIVVWHAWKLKPYAGLDRLDLDGTDPYFEGQEPDITRYLIGFRWDVNPFHAIKVEYQHDDGSEVTFERLAIQAAFTF